MDKTNNKLYKKKDSDSIEEEEEERNIYYGEQQQTTQYDNIEAWNSSEYDTTTTSNSTLGHPFDNYHHGGNDSSSPNVVMKYIPRFCSPYPNDKLEATGLALDMFGRGSVLMSSQFLGPALLQLATAAAAATAAGTENDNNNNDDLRIHGFKPSSLLSNIALIGGLLGTILLPVFGSIIDHTPYRWHVGMISACCLSVVKGIEVMISSQTWLFVALLQILSSVLYHLHICTTLAYTSELVDDNNSNNNNNQSSSSSASKRLTAYNTHYGIVLYVSLTFFLVEVILISSLVLNHDDKDDDNNDDTSMNNDVLTARISQVTTFLSSSTMFVISWRYLFQHRPPLRQLYDDNDGAAAATTTTTSRGKYVARLVSAGFIKVFYTFRQLFSVSSSSSSSSLQEATTNTVTETTTTNNGTRIHKHNNHYEQKNKNNLKWFLVAIAFGEAGSQAIASIGTTYMSTFLQMSSNEIGILFLIVLVMGIPGAKLGERISLFVPCRDSYLSSIVSTMICDIVFIVSTFLATITLSSPADKKYIVIFGVLWGLCLGWQSPMHNSAFMTLIMTTTTTTPQQQQEATTQRQKQQLVPTINNNNEQNLEDPALKTESTTAPTTAAGATATTTTISEWMGIYLLCTQILSWLPPLVFTALNELGFPMSMGLGSINFFFLTGALCSSVIIFGNCFCCHNNDHNFDYLQVSTETESECATIMEQQQQQQFTPSSTWQPKNQPQLIEMKTTTATTTMATTRTSPKTR